VATSPPPTKLDGVAVHRRLIEFGEESSSGAFFAFGALIFRNG
ncbi:hypothetical protein A2U01_0104573, partial [Trifolium medium]|nr:hypothetical protein [Trifolium medium]